ncbi:MAG TPA: DNA ligase D [Gammaproteobacteria bacterium]|nr:DNA ligase D [Gammaproteobacteria bacterium]
MPRAKRNSASARGALETYRRKRDFKRTPEPRGAARPGAAQLSFVVQKHDATRLHYDFRLEHRGVLKSWAVPKEPSYDPHDRRLAVRTEDHPLEYGSFEGEIPEGEYGAGSVVIWDRGTWSPLADVDRGLAGGKLDFELSGDRLVGRWTLVRMAARESNSRGGPRKPNGKENWLLIKRSDPEATRTRAAPKARTGKPRRPRRPRSAAAGPRPNDAPGARRAAPLADPRPQLATAVTAPPSGSGWLYEPKLDGYRLLCAIDGGRAALLTRRGNDWTDRFAAIAAAARELPCRSALLDGEAVVYDARGLTDFQRLQNSIVRGDPSIVLVAFDLLYLDGWDLRAAPLRERKALLERLLDGAPPAIRYSEHVEQDGAAFFREACRLGLEGIVAKRAGDPYAAGRSRSWLKVKCLERQELVIVGYTDPAGARSGFGALLLGARERAGAPLRYVGKVGTGFDERALRTLKARLEGLARRTSPVEPASAKGVGRRVHWVEPELVAEIAFSEWTGDGRLRQPVFHGLREDKPAAEVVLERPVPVAEAQDASDSPRAGAPRRAVARPPSKAKRAAAERDPPPGAARAVKLTHPDKVLFPDVGITKRELADYWEQVAPAALSYLERRPLTLFRCPNGVRGQCFFQKHVGVGVPSTVPRVSVRDDEEPYAYVEGLPSLLALVQIGALELHAWGSRAEHLDQPDIVVLDLDPDEKLAWSAVATAALELKQRLEALGLAAFLRLTGGKGLHVVVPTVPGPTWPAVKRFARALVDEMVRDAPKRFTASLAKDQRVGKIFIDYLRNDREATAIASYSPRARAGAPVALPIEWDELEPKARRAPRFGLRDVPKIVGRRKRDPWERFDAERRALV